MSQCLWVLEIIFHVFLCVKQILYPLRLFHNTSHILEITFANLYFYVPSWLLDFKGRKMHIEITYFIQFINVIVEGLDSWVVEMNWNHVLLLSLSDKNKGSLPYVLPVFLHKGFHLNNSHTSETKPQNLWYPARRAY